MARKTKEEALKTRQMLLDAAIEQFARRGVSNTTLTDIADAAGVTRGAVYWHFSSKSELFNAMWQEQLPLRDLVHHKLKQIETGNPLLDLRNKFVLGLQYIAETPRQRALMQILYHKCEFNSDMMSECEIRKKIGFGYDSVRNILQGCVRNQILPKDTNIEIILIVLYSAFSGLIKNWLMDPQQFDLYQQAPLLVDNIMSTVCAQSLWASRPALVVNQ
ncbi:TPA: acrEF/envCD operon transcriptional regulator [Kluyvera ascorbata]|uniref:acrEF/envCD operon transcriptional regulator n=1 Tax=Kluyvera TaxID=579 RepID=UPI002303AE9C|nr:acrEF/envCD operon transcriptional regulator [Kluyvera sp. Awk 3]MDA8489421.1 acrEF/envCD operon transcriptional regulator [Kluyvera sp. Awk 3]HCR3984396.1 acrEF/envCD operon transcriptional regulator [Kluyvera ascorbata]HDT6545120.1 acrEF/envCD operon transcriptional regulator [Kluyvera ascorbata]